MSMPAEQQPGGPYGAWERGFAQGAAWAIDRESSAERARPSNPYARPVIAAEEKS